MGTSPVTAFVESATGIADGGKTGITAIVTGIAFFVSVFFAPIFASIPDWATGGALVIVGTLMIRNVREINWDYIGDAVPAFLTIIMIPLTYKSVLLFLMLLNRIDRSAKYRVRCHRRHLRIPSTQRHPLGNRKGDQLPPYAAHLQPGRDVGRASGWHRSSLGQVHHGARWKPPVVWKRQHELCHGGATSSAQLRQPKHG